MGVDYRYKKTTFRNDNPYYEVYIWLKKGNVPIVRQWVNDNIGEERLYWYWYNCFVLSNDDRHIRKEEIKFRFYEEVDAMAFILRWA